MGRAAASGESRDKTTDGLGAAATQRQHALGKLTVRERIDLLVDDGSFTELNPLQGNHLAGSNSDREVSCTDGVVTGWGTVEGRAIFVYGQDFRVFGGALGEAHAAKIHDLMDMALTAGAPLVSLVDGGGARIHEGLSALAGYGGIFRRTVQASGVIPQISAVLGPAAGGAACAPALTDFVFMVRTVSQMYISGPDVVRAVTGESTTVDALGGADVHTEVSGTAGFAFDDERTCLRAVRRLLSLLPSNSGEVPPVVPCLDSPDRQCEVLLELVPSDSNHAYDVRAVIEEIVDDKDFLEIQERWAANVVCGLSRLGGHVVGIVANQPARLAGVLDTDATEKAARFVQFCDAFNIPLITLVDVPGFLPGLDQEHNGLIRDTAKLLYAYCNATVPRVQLVMRKAYGSAYIVMDSRSIGSDLSFAWPTNEMAVMDPDGAVNAIFRRRIAEADDPEAMHREMVEKYERDLMHPHYTAQQGLVNDVIDPARTREVLIRSLAVLRTKRDKRPVRKHGNLPL
ncbi:acyl-CoA carboxylase subunit beta [Streptomyces sp. NBC_00464]|uniref:acyl-CoA carboxylase subunit beta n=1 Tax=unclassified Streptomyces TaxID=2593676 RepID=UPI003FA74BA4